MNTQTTFKDILDKTFISMQSNYALSSIDILLNLTASLIVGLFIYQVYKKTFSGVLYQQSFNISLVAITMVITLVIMTISGNLILSLGMVGALSIVRFRTPIKDPVDLVFIFWAITVGIANGVGYFNISIIGSLFITIVLFIMSRYKEEDEAYLLILHIKPDSENEKKIVNELKKNIKSFSLKSSTKTKDYTEVVAEIRLKKDNLKLVKNIENQEKILKLTLISYTGELKNS